MEFDQRLIIKFDLNSLARLVDFNGFLVEFFLISDVPGQQFFVQTVEPSCLSDFSFSHLFVLEEAEFILLSFNFGVSEEVYVLFALIQHKFRQLWSEQFLVRVHVDFS